MLCVLYHCWLVLKVNVVKILSQTIIPPKCHDLSELFPITMRQRINSPIKSALYRKDVVRPNFSVDLAEHYCHELATLDVTYRLRQQSYKNHS
jgi:hypothetical protein